MYKRFGFTLAEILITLGIIGIVAAMTIPNLMMKMGTITFRTAFKEVYSSLNGAINTNVSLYANSDFSTLTGADFNTDGSIANMFRERLSIVKALDVEDSELESSATVKVSSASNYTLFLNDGAVVAFPQAAEFCSDNNWQANNCKAIVDVNGVKGPNKLTNCTSATATDDNAVCTKSNIIFADRFSIRFVDQRVSPNGNAVRYLLMNKDIFE